MAPRDLTDVVHESYRRLIVRAREITPVARPAFKKPILLGFLALRSWRAQVAAGVLALLLVFVLPKAFDRVTEFFFPPQSSKTLFGLVTRQTENPAKQVADQSLIIASWLVSTGAVGLLFWLHLPAGLAAASTRTRLLAAKADGLRETDRAKAIRLYRRACVLTTDPGAEAEFKTRIRELNRTYASRGDTDQAAFRTRRDAGGSQKPVSNFTDRRADTSVGPGGRYVLGPELGKGAMGLVYSARDTVLDRKVALKQLSAMLAGDEEYVSRFRLEAKALARLSHPNIVQVYDLIEENGRLWMALEYVDGGNLAARLKGRGRLPAREVVEIAVQVARGLEYTHDQGIIHRDLKPGNILMTRQNCPKVSDFGIARLSQSSRLTLSGSVMGSPPYMSPEQAAGGPADKRSDIYAFGIMLYELLTGRTPFEGDTASILAQHITARPRRLTALALDIPESLEKLILRMLAKKPADRPQDMATLIRLLSNAGVEHAPEIL